MHTGKCDCDTCLGKRVRGKLPPVPNDYDPDKGKFPVVGGVKFSRSPEGDVQVQFGNAAPVTILGAEWCSVVAHVADGGSADSYQSATELHKPVTP